VEQELRSVATPAFGWMQRAFEKSRFAEKLVTESEPSLKPARAVCIDFKTPPHCYL
jgi:hypothetical protein